VYPLFVIIPLVSIICLNLPLRKMMNAAAFWWLGVVAVCQALLAAGHILRLIDLNALVPSFLGPQADRLGAVALLSAGMVTAAVLSAAAALIKDKVKLFNFINLLFIALAGMNGVAVSRDIFSLYLFIEIAAVGSYILIAFSNEKLALEAAFKYIILSSAASAMMLTGIALIMLVTGSTDFAAVKSGLAGSLHRPLVLFAVAMFVCGLFIKGGQMPFHGWLPDVYSSSSPAVSVFLAGVVTKVLGAFVLIRLAFSVIDFSGPVQGVILFVGTLSIVAAAFAALGQKDIKRMFAYSSISQIGYILVGLGSGNPLGMAGAVLHIFNHSVFKSTLFLNAAALESQASTRDIDRLGGMATRMPVTAATSSLAILSAAGIPPLAGFWSKLLIIVALWTAGLRIYAVIAVLASVITLAYLLVMQRQVFWGHAKEEFAAVREAGFGLIFPACWLTAITVGLGLAFPFLLKVLKI
jgi:proton-translocating NADH-quinone oxidoreductase chain N